MPRPMIQVIQEVAAATVSTASPDLNSVIVGPCYNVLTYADDKAAILYATATYGQGTESLMQAPLVAPGTVAILDANRPGHVVGAILDDASVNIYFDDCYVVMDGNATSGTATVAALTPNIATVTGTLDTDAAGAYLMSPGDRVVMSTSLGASDTVRTVFKVISATQFSVTENWPAALQAAGNQWYVEHKLDDVLATFNPATDISAIDTITIPNAQVVSYRAANRTVSTAGVYVEYRELRQDLGAELSTFSTSTAALAALGKAVEENPLGLAANLFFANSLAPLYVLAVNSDNTAGHNAALDVLAARSDIYFIGVLSSTAAILASYSSHATVMSQPEVSKFRIAAGGGTLVTTLTKGTGVPTTNGLGNNFMDNASAEFITDGVAVGDTVVIVGSTGNNGTYTIASIESETRVGVSPTWPAAASVNGTYTITRTLDRQGQADNLELVPVSYDNKRMLLVWPDEITVEGVAVPGHFLVAVLGGMISSLPSHQGFTNVGVAGVDSLSNSNFYFTAAQIDGLSDAGWYVFIQESLSGLPFSVHQVTTAQSGLVDEVELNVVKNFDYISKQLQDALDGFLGRWNINASTLNIIRRSIDAVIGDLKSVTYPRLGARLIDGDVDSISQSTSDAALVECYVNLQLPKPLNIIRLHLISS